MKVIILSTYDTRGGAAIAAYRLMEALQKSQIDAKMLVAVKESDHPSIFQASSLGGNKRQFINLALEKALFLPHEKDSTARFQFSTANVGYSINKHPLIQEADVIHIHWTLQGFLSLNEIKKLQALNKKIAWTLHDMWAFTGGCHYSGNCNHYLQDCGHCQFLRKPKENDLSFKILNKKRVVYQNIIFTTCSTWLGKLAKSSSLLKNFPVKAIPNPIDINIYKPSENKLELRKKLSLNPNKDYILFGASSLSDTRKGLQYFIDAMNLYRKNHAQVPSVILYGSQEHDVQLDGYEVIHVGFLNQKELIQYYQASDIYAITSLEDNLPNTVMEAIACGLPILTFETGGIPDMVQHEKNGYVANYQSAEDIAHGLHRMLHEVDLEQWSLHSRNYCVQNFQEKVIAQQFIDLYQE